MGESSRAVGQLCDRHFTLTSFQVPATQAMINPPLLLFCDQISYSHISKKD